MSKLNAIAAEMLQKGSAHRTLGTLELVYQQQGAARRLALGREKVEPFQPEIEAARAAFAVPPGASERTFKTSRRHPKTRRQIVYHVVEMTWQHYARPEDEAAQHAAQHADPAAPVVAPAPAR